jgi:hypothetical protein
MMPRDERGEYRLPLYYFFSLAHAEIFDQDLCLPDE